jgi:hypothetical protein
MALKSQQEMFWLTPCGNKNLLVLHTLPLLDAFNHVVDYKSFDSLFHLCVMGTMFVLR